MLKVSLMQLKNMSGSSSKVNLERKAPENEFASPNDVAFKEKRRKISSVRHFPKGCGPPQRSKNEVQIKVLATADNLKYKSKLSVPFDDKSELGLITEVEMEQTCLHDSLNDGRSVHPSPISVCDTTVLPITIMQKKAQVCLPRRMISAIRVFPRGCGRKIQQPEKEVVPESIDLITNELGQNLADVETNLFHKNEEATTKTEGGFQKNIAFTINRNLLQSNSECMQAKDEKLCKNKFKKCLDGKLSGQSRIPGRMVVQALTAAQNCPWRRKSRRKKHQVAGRDFIW